MIYLVFVMFILFTYLINKGFFKDETLETSVRVLTLLTLASFIIYTSFKTRLRINAVHRNTGKALFMALIMIAITYTVSTLFGLVLGFAEKYMVANVIAMIGAFPAIKIIEHKFITALIFIIFIPIIESVTAINILDLMLSWSKSTYTLKDPKVYVASLLIGAGGIFYHIYAKFIPITKEFNIHALTIVGVLFVLTCLFAVHTKEMEAPIYGHIGNNGIAMWQLLKESIRFV